MTEVWYECPNCKKETYPNWETFSFAGNFVFHVVCAHCGCNIEINVSAVCQTANTLCGLCRKTKDECICHATNW